MLPTALSDKRDCNSALSGTMRTHSACARRWLCGRKNCKSSSNGKSCRNSLKLYTSVFRVCRRGPRGSKSHGLRRFLTKHHACAEHSPRPHVTLAYSVKSQEQPLVGLFFCQNVKMRALHGQCSSCAVSTADFRNVGVLPRYTILERVQPNEKYISDHSDAIYCKYVVYFP